MMDNLRVQEYDKIIDYIKNETGEFIKFNGWLYRKMPLLLSEFKRDMGVE